MTTRRARGGRVGLGVLLAALAASSPLSPFSPFSPFSAAACLDTTPTLVLSGDAGDTGVDRDAAEACRACFDRACPAEAAACDANRDCQVIRACIADRGCTLHGSLGDLAACAAACAAENDAGSAEGRDLTVSLSSCGSKQCQVECPVFASVGP